MANGVQVRGQRIRIQFRFEGKKRWEPLPDLTPTPENVAYAERMVEQIRYEINNGKFNYAKYFPNSTHLSDNRFGKYLDIWLEIKATKVADSTMRSYRSHVENHIRPKFGTDQADGIDYINIESWISQELSALASKTIKEIVAIMHQVFTLYRTRRPGAIDPTENVTIGLPDDSDPDPFTRDEIDRMFSVAPYKGYWNEFNACRLMIWTGPRVSEALALGWDDVVDLEKGLIHFRRAMVRGIYKVTKTKRSNRTIELVRPAREALQDQFKLTGHLQGRKIAVKDRDNRTIKHEEVRFVFQNSISGQPYTSEQFLRDNFFKPHLESVDVRYRGPGQSRHTYISHMLTAGMPIEWIVKQVGHGSAEMIRRKYGKWMQDDQDDWITTAEKRLYL